MKKYSSSLVILALFLCGGCYRYVPVERYQAPAGSEVRVTLTMDGEDEVRGTLGPGVTSLDGPLVRWDSEGLGLQTQLSISREGYPATTMTEILQLQPHHIARVELRELDGRRTAVFTAGVVGAAAVAAIAPSLFGGNAEGSGEGDETDPDAAIVLFRIPIGFGGGR